jgi:beta-galactosidase
MGRYPTLGERVPGLLHGGDYFPEQWLHDPAVLEEDIRLMKRARCNVVSMGMFAWSALEPEEGRFRFDWLDRQMDRLAEAGIHVFLATPTGARPAWMSQRYPEVLRVSPERRRNLHGLRHNHCYTSPVYREKARTINRMLAERYGRHPALLLWHVSNEYGGECHCELCQEAFRKWLRCRYEDDLGKLNAAWWTSFWSNTYSDWRQVESPAPHGEPLMQELQLDWKRFVTDQTTDFMRIECAPLRELAPSVPITTNMMGTYGGLDYWKLARHLDVASLTSYPSWHGKGPVFDPSFPWDPQGRDWVTASVAAFVHDLMRSLKGGRPFLLMESSPTFSNWHAVWKLKRPGMHALSSLLAVAHGADSVQYFQWRKNRGGLEKFHGAVVDHAGTEHARVFEDVAGLGRLLEGLSGVAGTATPAQTAIVFDWENRWALESSSLAPRAGNGSYEDACVRHHRAFWTLGVPTDIIDGDTDFTPYRLLVAPMLAMVRPGMAERLEQFVRSGGILVATYATGLVNENDVCFLGGFPGPLRTLLGIWVEESDGLYPVENNSLIMGKADTLGLRGTYSVSRRCELLRAESARVLGFYGEDFYRGRPAFTMNDFGDGHALYIGADAEDRFHEDLYRALARRLALPSATGGRLPEGVGVRIRSDGTTDFLFLLNFSNARRRLRLAGGPWKKALTGAPQAATVSLDPLGFEVLQRRAAPDADRISSGRMQP